MSRRIPLLKKHLKRMLESFYMISNIQYIHFFRLPTFPLYLYLYIVFVSHYLVIFGENIILWRPSQSLENENVLKVCPLYYLPREKIYFCFIKSYKLISKSFRQVS